MQRRERAEQRRLALAFTLAAVGSVLAGLVLAGCTQADLCVLGEEVSCTCEDASDAVSAGTALCIGYGIVGRCDCSGRFDSDGGGASREVECPVDLPAGCFWDPITERDNPFTSCGDDRPSASFRMMESCDARCFVPITYEPGTDFYACGSRRNPRATRMLCCDPAP